MTKYLLIRHGDADYSQPAKWKAPGWGADLAPLSELGLTQIESVLPSVKFWKPDLILSSPTTRTLQGAAILQASLGVPLKVEFDLHEWIPDRSFAWVTLADVMSKFEDLEKNNGEWPKGEERAWEPLSSVHKRVTSTLYRYSAFERVAVMCHGVVTRALTGKMEMANAECVEYELS